MSIVRRAGGVGTFAPIRLAATHDLRYPWVPDARQLARVRACDVFSVYVGKAGGIGPARAITDFALSQGIACTIGSNLELGVGLAAMTHLGLAHHGITPDDYPCDIIGPFYYVDDILTEPLPLVPGRAAAADRPRLGADLDVEKVETYRVR